MAEVNGQSNLGAVALSGCFRDRLAPKNAFSRRVRQPRLTQEFKNQAVSPQKNEN